MLFSSNNVKTFPPDFLSPLLVLFSQVESYNYNYYTRRLLLFHSRVVTCCHKSNFVPDVSCQQFRNSHRRNNSNLMFMNNAMRVQVVVNYCTQFFENIVFILMFINDTMCSPRKHLYSLGNRRDWNFLGVVGFCKTQKIKEMYEG